MDVQQRVAASIQILNKNLRGINNDYYSIAVFYADELTKEFFIEYYTQKLEKTVRKNIFLINNNRILTKHIKNVQPRSLYIFDVQELLRGGVLYDWIIKYSFIVVPRSNQIWAFIVDRLDNVDNLLSIRNSTISLLARI